MSRRAGDLVDAIDEAINKMGGLATDDDEFGVALIEDVQGVLLECAEAILLYRMVINSRHPDGTDKVPEEVDAVLQKTIDARRQMRLMR